MWGICLVLALGLLLVCGKTVQLGLLILDQWVSNISATKLDIYHHWYQNTSSWYISQTLCMLVLVHYSNGYMMQRGLDKCSGTCRMPGTSLKQNLYQHQYIVFLGSPYYTHMILHVLIKLSPISPSISFTTGNLLW